MDLKRLSYFAQVAELGSVLRTSERIGVAQPALSRQIKLLEKELGVTLFTRKARGMQLSEAGRSLYSRIAGPLGEIGDALYEVRAKSSEIGGSVVLGMPPTIVQMLAGALARRVDTFLPNISLRIVDAYTGHLFDWMLRGELDAAILYGPTQPGMNATELLEDDMMLVGPSNSPIAGDGVVDLSRLGEVPLILPSPGHGLRILIDSAAHNAGTEIDVHIQADSYQLMKELVESGLGYTVLPHCAFAREAAAGRLSFARIANPPIRRQLIIALRANAEWPRAVSQVVGLARQEVTTLIEQGVWSAVRLYKSTPAKHR